MHELYKLKEAHYFLKRMSLEHDDPTNFRFELSAFLGAARSVLQYALKEAQSRSGGEQWYQQAITGDPLFTFFKNQRDANIHSVPVSPATRMETHISEYLRMDDDTMIPYRHHTSSYHHRFADWPEDEAVIDISQRYLNALQDIVNQ